MLNVDKDFLKFLIYMQIKRRKLVLEFEINYEKDFLAKNQDADLEKKRAY